MTCGTPTHIHEEIRETLESLHRRETVSKASPTGVTKYYYYIDGTFVELQLFDTS